MKQPSIDSIQELLAHTALQRLASQTVKLQHLQQLLNADLDTALSAHCKVADFSAGILTLVIDSSAFASRLRYLQHSLLSSLKKYNEFSGLYKIEWLISPSTPALPKPLYQRTLSKQSANLLIDTANSCENEELKAVLLRLASRAN